jgi:hypothetical protein
VKPHTSSPRRRTPVPALVAVLALAASVAAALLLPATAMATPCGDAVLADWFDNGRIDRLYQAHCYEEAIDSIPDDLRDYANAEEIITRALQASLRGEFDAGGPDPTPGDDEPTPPTTPTEPSDPGGGSGGGSEAAPDVDTTGISSVPIPLLVLGGMSIALLAAGGLGYLSRRRAAAHEGDGDAPGPPDPLT